jgi:hypothetical protein
MKTGAKPEPAIVARPASLPVSQVQAHPDFFESYYPKDQLVIQADLFFHSG